MGVFDLVGNVLNKQSQEETNFLSLTLTSNKILASIWQLTGDSLNFIGYSSKNFHNIDSLINEAAVAIDSAAQHLKSDVTQVVFGLSNYWFEEGKVSKETSNILKNLSDELELEAQAFVPIAASVNHFLKLKDEPLAQSIFIGAYKDFTEVSLQTADKITPKVFKGPATKESVIRLLKELKQEETLTSGKVVIFNPDSELHKEFEKTDLKEILGEDFKPEQFEEEDIAKCVAFSQAADVLGHEPVIAQEASGVVSPGVQESSEEKSLSEVTPVVEEVHPQEAIEKEEFDFRENEDVLALEEAHLIQPEEVTTPEAQSLDNLKKPDEYAVEVDKQEQAQTHSAYESPAQKVQEANLSHKKSFLDNLITLGWLSKITSSVTKGQKGKKILIPIIVVAIVLAIVAYFGSLTFTNAQVIVKANSQPQEEDIDVTVAAGATTDTTRSRIPGNEVTETAADTAQAQATGTKKTGNNAKGEVTVLNWTTSSVTFDKGTALISKNGVKFQLDSQVQIASRSASTPGEANVNVVALDFGTNGNVSAGTDFTFQKYDELLYSAKNDNAFSGGDEKQINVVSQDDLTKLETSLKDQLTTKARNSLKEKNPSDQLSDDAIAITVNKKQFDKNLDDEATTIKLDMEIQATALVYDQNTLKDLLAQKAQEDSQDKLVATAENIDLLSVNVKRTKDTLKLSGRYRANLVPNINLDDLKTKIAGKSQKDARAIIKENPDVADVEIKFTPNMLLFSSVPKNTSKITIKIEAIK